MPLASLAILIPRLAFIGSSSLHRGYDALGQPVRSTAHVSDRPLATNGVWAAWPLAFGSAPGAYVGAVMLLAVVFAWRDRARRALVVAFGGCLVAHVAPHAERDRHGRLVPDAPAQGAVRRRVPAQPRPDAVPVDDRDPGPGRDRAPGSPRSSDVRVPCAAAARGRRRVPARGAARSPAGTPYRFILLAVAMLAAVPTLYWLATARKRWAMTAVVVVVGIELLGERRVLGHVSGRHDLHRPRVGRATRTSCRRSCEYPDLSEADFLRPTAFVDIIRGQPDRYLTYAPPAASFDKGYLFTQRPQDWPALAMERGTLFGIPDVLGYNPVQLPRYWTYIRATNSNPVFYNASVLGLPVPAERAADGRAVPRRSDGRRGGARGPGRGERRRLRPRAGVRMGAARLARGHVDAGRASGGRARRRPRSDVRPRAHRLRRAGSGHPADAERDARARRRTERSRPRTSASR